MRASALSELDGRIGAKDGDAVEVGFRPSGELHIGNLTAIATAGIIADRYDMTLQLTCCDTDWDANTHELVRPDNSRVMQHYFERTGPGEASIAEHRYGKAEPYIDAIVDHLGVDMDFRYMSDVQRDSGFRESLHRLLSQMDEFDSFWGGVFRRRWISPVSPVCECGFSPAKGASYGAESRTLTFPCWNDDCPRGFHEARLDGSNDLGIYYLVDPIRDTSCRPTAVHVFGGDYRDAKKGQKTSKLTKVEKVTRLANGENPHYFVAPLLVSEEGLPLSKSKNTGIFLDDLPPPERFVEKFVTEVETVIEQGRGTLVVNDRYSERSDTKVFN